jgi:myosin-5
VNGFAAAAATENDKSIMSAILNNTLTNSNGTHAPPPPPPQIKSKNSGEFMGIFEWKCEDEATIVTKLMEELKPRLAVTFLPGLPAYALFMCIRYADMLNDDERVRSLLNSSVQSVKRLIKRKQEDLEYVVLWMTNFCRLIHNLKQYSGESAFQIHNAKQQNEHCLKNFDLAEYRGILSDIAIWLFQGIIKDFEKKLNPIIVPAMLEHESLPGINESSKLNSTINNKSLNNSKDEANKSIEKSTIDSLIKKLNEFLKILNSHGIDPEIVNQIFKQIFYFIGANTFNNLILRKEMCHWSKGIELRYNISFLEQWIRDSKLQESGASETLEPVIQASQLLQARKSDSDIKSICDMCPKLTIAQIQRILFMYTPVEAYEEKLTRQFIDKVTNNLKELRATEDNSAQQILILDTQKQYPICIPFNPSNIGLETIELPEQLNMNGLLKKI